MTEMITIKAHRYAGKMRAPGDRYQSSGQQQKLIMALGWSKPAPPPVYFVPDPEPVVLSYVRRDVVAEPPSAVEQSAELATFTADPVISAEPDADAPRPKRAYRRRDLTAES